MKSSRSCIRGNARFRWHVLGPGEKRCHALGDVLDFRKIINTKDKRRVVEALGSEIVSDLSYYKRWIVSFTNILIHNGTLTPRSCRAGWTR